MKKGWQIFRRMAVLLLVSVWFGTVAHTVVCHSENAWCGHDGCSEATVCSCFCHQAIEPFADLSGPVEQGETVWISVSNETILALLLPSDIFRPPLANS